jgi:hypothetical protein
MRFAAYWKDGLWWRFGWQTLLYVLAASGEHPYEFTWPTGGRA